MSAKTTELTTAQTQNTAEIKALTPEWLTKEFLKEHFRNYYKNPELEIIKFEAKHVSANGESFLSSMYRVKVKFTNSLEDSNDKQESIAHLIIKVAFSDEDALDVELQQNMYDKEIEFYGTIAPQINKKLQELGEPQLVAECFGVCKTRRIIILEDLAVKSYETQSIQRGYNIQEAKVILKRLATFHAICAALQDEQSDIFANIKSGHFTRDMDTFNNIYVGNLEVIIEVISNWPNFTVYAEKLRRLQNDLIERLRQPYDVKPNQFNTLNHDDLWCPNLMLQFENESIENVVFIDFQFAYWGSSATDLHYLLASSICKSLRPHCFDELTKFYYGHLIGILTKLKYQQHIPTWSEFQEQYHQRHFIAFAV
ncbi:uncharacterized protein LOC129572899 [Sitodiplosis mosellana]|uniref:uncharacterized protein LOC129572899 n=1 Tax=Sitodiplosis mosellana TaxID=263140 RepID=UPI0024438884|nr:uncharacterized protein LOC129572899 [Sitodiplosis mosellana]